MIIEIVKLWEENKHKLEEYFKTTKQEEYDSYETIIRKIFELCINVSDDYYNNFNLESLHIIDDGNWEGTLIFIVPKNISLPDAEDYIVTDTYYGSCSGCDTLLSILSYSEDLPSESQVKELMTLALHLVQKMRWLSSSE